MYLIFISAVSYLHVQLRGGERGQVGCVRAGDTDTTSCSGEMEFAYLRKLPNGQHCTL